MIPVKGKQAKTKPVPMRDIMVADLDSGNGSLPALQLISSEQIKEKAPAKT